MLSGHALEDGYQYKGDQCQLFNIWYRILASSREGIVQIMSRRNWETNQETLKDRRLGSPRPEFLAALK